MKKTIIQTRKTIALTMTAALIVFVAWSMLTGVSIPGEFKTLAVSCISFYFGKSTALETPKNAKDGE